MRGLTHARTRLEVPVEAIDAIPWGALTPSALLLLAVLLWGAQHNHDTED